MKNAIPAWLVTLVLAVISLAHLSLQLFMHSSGVSLVQLLAQSEELTVPSAIAFANVPWAFFMGCFATAFVYSLFRTIAEFSKKRREAEASN